MIDATFVTAIEELSDRASAVQVLEIGGHEYTDRTLHLVREPKRPEPAPLVVHTLSGFAGYVAANRDSLPLDEYMVHVTGPDQVELISPARGEHHQRLCFVIAANYDRFAAVPSFGFGRWMEPEAMIIALQALFQETGDRARVLQLLGNIRDEDVKTRTDDGVSQSVNTRSGVAVVERTDVPNPVRLAPYRTFPDVGDQPMGTFVFRLRKGSSGVEAALFEADGGAWRNLAIASIAHWLRVCFAADGTDISILA